MPGFIAQVAVGDNQEVRAGDLLVKLDDRDYRAALAKADAVVSIQQAGLTNLAATRYLQEALVEEAEASVASAEAEISRAHDDQARYQRLSINARRFPCKACKVLRRSPGRRLRRESARGSGRAAANDRDRRLKTRQTRAALDWGLLPNATSPGSTLGETELRAPIDGIVRNRAARRSLCRHVAQQLISSSLRTDSGSTPTSRRTSFARMRSRQAALVKADVWHCRVLHAHVASLAALPPSPVQRAQAPENATGIRTKIVQRVAVRILLDEEDATPGRLLPGLSVTAEVDSRFLTAPARSTAAEIRNQAAAGADGHSSRKGVL